MEFFWDWTQLELLIMQPLLRLQKFLIKLLINYKEWIAELNVDNKVFLCTSLKKFKEESQETITFENYIDVDQILSDKWEELNLITLTHKLQFGDPKLPPLPIVVKSFRTFLIVNLTIWNKNFCASFQQKQSFHPTKKPKVQKNKPRLP